MTRANAWSAAAAAALMLVFTLQLARVAQTWSASWDEPHHLYDGYTIWTRGDHRLNPEVPPLVKLVAALPLLGAKLTAPPNQGRAEPEEAFRDGRAFVFTNGPGRTLMPARHACMLLALALAALTGFAAWRLFGVSAGVTALALVTFDPTLLANGPLVTTDVASALFIFAAALAFLRAGRSLRLAWLLAAGVATGLAMASKFTGLLLAPMLLLIAVWDGAATRSLPTLGRRLAGWAGVMLIAWALVWAAYGFRYAAAPGALGLSPPLDDYLRTLPSAADGRLLTLLAHLRLLPEGFIWGLANTKLTELDDTSYLFGHVWRHGPWWYFPAAFLIKSTLPLLILLGVAIASRLDRRIGARLAVGLLIPVAVYVVVVSSSHFDIGVRHLLPIYPFLYVFAAGAAASLARSGRPGAILAAGLVGWQALTCLLTWPAWMAYANEAWGGPAQTHRYLSDANVDWGQQLKGVKAYLDATHAQGDCWFAYFPDGAIDPADYGVNCRRLPTTETLWWLKSPMDVPPVISGTVLISASDLASFEFGPGELNPYAALAGLKPDAVIQGGVDAYRGRFAVPLAAALVEVRRSLQQEAAGDAAGALATARDAARLAPRSARAQLRLAEMLTATGAPGDALTRLSTAQRLVDQIRPDLESPELTPKIAEARAAALRAVASDAAPDAAAAQALGAAAAGAGAAGATATGGGGSVTLSRSKGSAATPGARRPSK